MTTDSEPQRLRVFDLHCDTLDRLAEASGAITVFPWFGPPVHSVSLRDTDAHLSLDRMQDFDWCQCLAIFIPDHLKGEAAWRFYQRVRQFFHQQLEENADRLAQAYAASDIEEILSAGKCAALLTIEGASFFEDSPAPVEELAADGVKMLTLTWNDRNALAGGSTSSGGLTSLGKQVVRELEEHRIVVDVSHINDESFADLLSVATRPFAASHSDSRSVCPHPRNLTDDQFRAIQERGGIVGLNYSLTFLTEEKREASPDDVLRHIDHWLELGGEKTIALGSDYDGTDVPAWLESGDKLPTLYAHVAGAFGAPVADDLFFNNAQRFFLNAEKRA